MFFHRGLRYTFKIRKTHNLFQQLFVLCCPSLFYCELTRQPLKPVALVKVHLVSALSNKDTIVFRSLSTADTLFISTGCIWLLLYTVWWTWPSCGQSLIKGMNIPLATSVASPVTSVTAYLHTSPFHFYRHLGTAQAVFAYYTYLKDMNRFSSCLRYFRAKDRL